MTPNLIAALAWADKWVVGYSGEGVHTDGHACKVLAAEVRKLYDQLGVAANILRSIEQASPYEIRPWLAEVEPML